MNKWVTIKKFSEASGYSEDAIRAKVKKGVWIERKQYIRGPDRRILINVEEVNQWLENIAA